MELPFMMYSPSSPSLDMEAALQQLSRSSWKPLDMACNSESSFSSEDSDVLMMDPFLDYINEVLMEGGMEDAMAIQQIDADANYRAIVSGFYEIIGECSPPNLSVDSTSSEDNCDVPVSDEKGPDEQHVQVCEPNDGLVSLIDEGHKLGLSTVPLPANDNLHSNLQQGTAEIRDAICTPCESKSTMAQGYHGALKLNNGGTVDMTVSAWGEAAAVESLTNGGSYNSKEQGNDQFCPPAADEFTLKLIDIGVSFEDLKIRSDYTALYVGDPSSSEAGRGSRRNGDERKSLAVSGKSRKYGNKGAAEIHGFVDPREVLLSCAQAVAVGDVRKANEILLELRQVHGASAEGSGLQRAAHYFGEALTVRMRGLGNHQFRDISHNMPSSWMLLKASKMGFEVTPYTKIMHYFANQNILKAAEGASRLHIVDYGLLYGMQWPCLINALADRKGGPPLLVITGIEFPQPGNNPAERVEESGRRLAAYARTYNVPFQFHAIATSKWEDLDRASLHLHEDEVLVVNCIKRLRHLADESVDLSSTTSPRQKLLTCMRNLNPHLLVFAEVNAAYNSPFFVSRFREALSNTFDMLDTLWGDSPERLLIERTCMYRDILNIVACEGAERVEKPETYRQWQVRIKKAGFKQVPIPPTILSRSRSHVKQQYHKDFIVHDDANGWMLLGWKGRPRIAISVWRPSHV